MERMLIAVLFATCIAITSIAHLGGGEIMVYRQTCPACQCPELLIKEKNALEEKCADYRLSLREIDLSNESNPVGIFQIMDICNRTITEVKARNTDSGTNETGISGYSSPYKFTWETRDGSPYKVSVLWISEQVARVSFEGEDFLVARSIYPGENISLENVKGDHGYKYSEQFEYDLEFMEMEDWETALLQIINETGDVVGELRVRRLEGGNESQIAQTFNMTGSEGEEYMITVHEVGYPWCFGAQWVNVSLSKDWTSVNGILHLGNRLLKKDERMVIE
jgi:hypothetical protein